MKLVNTLSLFSLCSAKPSIMGETLAKTVRRTIQGDWVNRMMPREKRDDLDGEKGFRPLAAMMLYMQGFDKDNRDPQSHSDFETQLDDMEAKYTSYGCYCWIHGVESGVVGGGKTKDITDHHCKELYRCYKCVNMDYAKNYTDVSYVVDFTNGDNGRELDCSVNAQTDAENICECDKRFATNIAETKQHCDAGTPADETYGEYCMDEQFRTIKGFQYGTNQLGTFRPTTCEKTSMWNSEDLAKCCGLYPERRRYRPADEECCELKLFGGDAEIVKSYRILEEGKCASIGGTAVESVEGDPHNYIVKQN